MGLLSWIFFGAIAGWVASLLTGRNNRMGCLSNIIIGVAGAFVGGFLVNLLGAEGGVTGFNIRSFGVAILGSVLLLAVTGWYSKRKR